MVPQAQTSQISGQSLMERRTSLSDRMRAVRRQERIRMLPRKAETAHLMDGAARRGQSSFAQRRRMVSGQKRR